MNTPALADLSPAPAHRGPSRVPAFSPLYRQIKDLILAGLLAGEWRPGELIPSEVDLAARYQVSQGTVRKAIDELALENLVVRRQGKGTFVATHAEQQVQYRFLKLYPDDGDRTQEGPAERHIIDCRRVRASADIAKALALRTGEGVLQLRRVLAFSGKPTILEDIWLPAQPFRGLTAERLAASRAPMYAMFEAEFGVRMVRATEKLRAVLPDAEQAELLRTDQSTPLLRVDRTAFTYNDTPMEVRRGLYLTAERHYRNDLG
jgi:GntR family transcriptional regulator